MHLLLGVIRTLRGYDNNKDESDSYRRCRRPRPGRGHFIVVCHFSCCFLAWPLALLCYTALLLPRHIFEWTCSHSQQLEREDYLAKMLLKKLYVNQLQANKILLRATTHWKVEFLISFGVSDAKEVSIISRCCSVHIG